MGRAQSGFTLVELAVTAAIVGVLAAGALPLAEIAVKRGKELELRHALRQMRGAIDEYRAAVEAGRVKRQPTESGYPKSLEALVEGVPDTRAAGARIYFLRRLPRDPFADPGLAAGATWGRRSYASPPEAPREGDDVYDVYALSAATGLNGVPYRQW